MLPVQIAVTLRTFIAASICFLFAKPNNLEA
ncbi:hypothetical protein GALL_332700 [mine drainage metagenome]|uniref:Uncharacterized protein n=1 Tax=mine drainage metagenome TaxID=410659 RepID=A0A1J5QMY6_9ZZZZ